MTKKDGKGKKKQNNKSQKKPKDKKIVNEKNKENKKVQTINKKKKFLVIIPVIIILCLIILTWYMLSNPSSTAKAQLIIDSGTVHFKHDSGSWVSAQNGMLLYQSDSLKTGNNTTASVILFESSIIRLDSNTEITIEQIIQEEDEINVKIIQDSGRTWNTVAKISGIDNYEVHTPTTVASVRGTSFDVNISDDGNTTIGVGNGTVKVSSIENGTVKDTIETKQNQSVLIDPKKMDQPLETKPFKKDDWIIKNQQKDKELQANLKAELYRRIEQYIPQLKEEYGITDEELDVLIEGYILGYLDLPPDTPQWIKDLFTLS